MLELINSKPLNKNEISKGLKNIPTQFLNPLWQGTAIDLLKANELEKEQIRQRIIELTETYVNFDWVVPLLNLLKSEPFQKNQIQAYLISLPFQALSSHLRQLLLDLLDIGTLKEEQIREHLFRIISHYYDSDYSQNVDDIAPQDFANYLVKLAEGVRQEIVERRTALSELEKACDQLGRFLGYEDEEFPQLAYWVGHSAILALAQVSDNNFIKYFIEKNINQNNSYYTMRFEGDAFIGSLIAYAGKYRDNMWAWEFDQQKRKEFCEWWLTEAIPQAWELAHQSANHQ